MAVVPALLCVAVGHYAVAVYAPRFTLSWKHSMEYVEWRETWKVRTKTMQVVEARIKGTGAGMEPPRHAVLKDGWFIYTPKSPPQEQLVLPDSGFTRPMRLCLPKDVCRSIRTFLPREAPKDELVVLSVAVDGQCGGDR